MIAILGILFLIAKSYCWLLFGEMKDFCCAWPPCMLSFVWTQNRIPDHYSAIWRIPVVHDHHPWYSPFDRQIILLSIIWTDEGFLACLIVVLTFLCVHAKSYSWLLFGDIQKWSILGVILLIAKSYSCPLFGSVIVMPDIPIRSLVELKNCCSGRWLWVVANARKSKGKTNKYPGRWLKN